MLNDFLWGNFEGIIFILLSYLFFEKLFPLKKAMGYKLPIRLLIALLLAIFYGLVLIFVISGEWHDFHFLINEHWSEREIIVLFYWLTSLVWLFLIPAYKIHSGERNKSDTER